MEILLVIVIVLLLIITFYFSKPLFLIVLAGSTASLIVPKFIGGNIDQRNYNPVDIDGKFDYLAGPVSFTIMKGDKNIILCGDFHTYENIVCNKEVYLPDYLEWLFRENNGQIFDIFTETPYNYDKTVKPKKFSGLFDNYVEKFGKCFEDLLKKDFCAKNYPNVRFHVSDYRNHYKSREGNIKTVLSKYFDFFEFMFKNDSTISMPFYDEANDSKNLDIEGLFNNLFVLSKIDIYDTIELLDNEEIFIKNFCDDLLADPKLKRNFDATGDMQPHILNYVKNNIKDFLQNKTENLKFLVNVFKNRSKIEVTNDYDNKEKLLNAIQTIQFLMLRLGAFIMDFYLLCRIFKKFDIKKESYIKEPETKNVIIIAGDAHIRTYKKFLTSVGYKIEFETANKNKCLDVQQMPNKVNELIIRNL